MRKQLSAAFVRNIKTPGKYGDLHGLILRVRETGSKQWIWRGTVRGKRVDLGLGGYPYTTLAEARQKAFDYRKLSRQGDDPRTLRDTAPTFEEAARKVLAIHRKTWKPGGGSEEQWRVSMTRYALPHLGRRRVTEITPADVMATLLAGDLWTDKPVTASRVRQRVSAVMKWAIAQGHRQDNPAGEALGAALPKHNGRKKHFKALPPARVAGAIATVQASGAWVGTKLAFEFLVLTASRVSEVRLATWDEFGLEGETWTLPASRMKAGKQHRVPLSRQALEVLAEARERFGNSDLVFPSVKGREIPVVGMSLLLRRLNVGAVPHGFRSSFRDWCGETGVDRTVAERCLAHAVRNPVEAAYARSDLFERRRKVMERWAEYLRLANLTSRSRDSLAGGDIR